MAQSHLDAHYLKVSQVADLLQLTESAVYQLCQQGELPAVKVTEKSIRIPAKALETYLRRLNKDTQGEMYIMNPVEYDKTMTRAEFVSRTGFSPKEWMAAWRKGEMEENREIFALTMTAYDLIDQEAPAPLG